MEIAKLQVNGVQAKTVWCMGIPHGISGGEIALAFSPEWEGLRKTVVFEGCCTKDVLDPGERVTIPGEVVAAPGGKLRVGLYGVDDRDQTVIPTLWAELGPIRYGTDPSGDGSTDPQLPVWAQLQSRMGDVQELETQNKENLVAAINELARLRQEIPYIGGNGNWWIGSEDTGISTEGFSQLEAGSYVGQDGLRGGSLGLKHDLSNGTLAATVSLEGMDPDRVTYRGRPLRQIFGASIITGGGFEEGLPGIGGKQATNPYAELEICSGVSDLGNCALMLTANGTAGRFITLPSCTYVGGHAYYVAMRARVDSYTQGQFGIQGVKNIYAPAESTLGAWVTVSGISHSTGNRTFNTYIGGMKVSSLDNKAPHLTGYLDNVVLLDLTEIFGAGQEPDKGQMDRLFNLYIQLQRGHPETQRFLLSDSPVEGDWPEEECIYAFMQGANRKAASLGLKNSRFGTPAGLPGAPGNDLTTPTDIMKLLLACYSSDVLAEILATKSCTFRTWGPEAREITVNSALHSGTLPGQLGQRGYRLFGGKGGSLTGESSGQGEHGILNWVLLCGVGSRQVAVAVMGLWLDDGAGSIIGDVLDHLYAVLAGENTENVTLGQYLEAAVSRGEYPVSVAACEMPGGSLRAWDSCSAGDLMEQFRGFASGAETVHVPGSVVKLLTARMVVDLVSDLDGWVTVSAGDRLEGSGQELYAGETLSYRQLLYLMLLESNNTAAMTLARSVGRKILRRGFRATGTDGSYTMKRL